MPSSMTKEEIKELVDLAHRYLPHRFRLPRPLPPAKKTLSDSEIKDRRDRLNAQLEGLRFLQKTYDENSSLIAAKNGSLKAKQEYDLDDDKESDVDQKKTTKNDTRHDSRHDSDDEEEEPPRKRACIE